MQILDDDRLESLQCTKCRKYLSIFPVENHPSRDVTCGRCSGHDDDAVRSTRYELIAERYLFKCVNRYEGCRKLLRVAETEAHEEVCVGSVFACPKCRDGTEMSVLQLIWHYKLCHPASYLKKNSFRVKVPDDDAMLYVQDEVVFFILLQSRSNVLYLNAVTLADVGVVQTFSIVTGKCFQRTDTRPCKSVNTFKDESFSVGLNPDESVEVMFELKVSKSAELYNLSVLSTATATVSESKPFGVELMTELKKYFDYKLNDEGTVLVDESGVEVDLTCSNCKQVIGLPIFRCKKSRHQICYGCRAWCALCDFLVVQADSDDPLVRIGSLLRFPCKWRCGRRFGSDLRAHEAVCELRMKKCPDCFVDVHLEFMKGHMSSKHGKYYCEEYDADEVVKFITKDYGEVYFTLNDKWCSLKWFLGNDRKHYLYFSLVYDEPNAKLGVVFCNSNFSCNNHIQIVDLSAVPSYKPFLKLK